jgi:bifunctional non-homologous end joining protein LigD
VADVDPGAARPGGTFVIHQHYATRLHWDLRLEMFNGRTPVLVSWAVPKGMPRRKGKGALAIHVEDHPFEYGSFSGSIPEGNYGAGAVRIFDEGTYEMLEQKKGNIRFRLLGKRLQGVYRLVETDRGKKKNEWLCFLSSDERPKPQPKPPLDPMLSTLIAEPFDDPAWAFEPKWDGIRAVAVCDETTTLTSRNDRDITVAYPELHGVHHQLVAIDAILDGEIVAFDQGVPSFEKLQGRMHVRGAAEIQRLSKTIPVAYVVFDMIYLDGRDLRKEPYTERRRLLEETVVTTPWLQVSPATPEDGTALFEAARSQGLEGIVGKRLDSHYEPGTRSKSWFKVKTTYEADVVIAGWTEGAGRRSGELGSVVLAVYDGEELRYIGGVGTGFTDRTREITLEALEPLATDEAQFEPKLRGVHWVRPELVAVIEFRQLTAAGKLRAPSFKGMREDKNPRDCTFEQLRQAACS